MIKKPIKLQSTLYLNREEYDEVIHRLMKNKAIIIICTGLSYKKEYDSPYELEIYMEVVE